MKPFKYKVWDNITRMFIPSDQIVFGDGFALLKSDLENWKRIVPKKGDFTITLFSGLEDINGKEIYEGDVIQFYPDIKSFCNIDGICSNLGHVWIFQITDGVHVSFNSPYSETFASLKDIKNQFNALENNEGNPYLNYEVVGNIFETPNIFKI